jgi:hypothetical protein
MEILYKEDSSLCYIILKQREKITAEELVYDFEHFTEANYLISAIINKHKTYIHLENLIYNSFKGIVNLTDCIDVRYTISVDEKIQRLFNSYKTNRETAYNTCINLLEKYDTINFREEETLKDIDKKYDFGFVLKDRNAEILNNMNETASDILNDIKRLKNEN